MRPSSPINPKAEGLEEWHRVYTIKDGNGKYLPSAQGLIKAKFAILYGRPLHVANMHGGVCGSISARFI